MTYEEKLKLAKEALDSGSYDKETIEYIFPELAENEDERIRKELIKEFKELNHRGFPSFGRVKVDSILAWLEKQGEQKPVDFSDLRTWKYIIDAVLTEIGGIGQYLDSPITEEVAKKLQKRFGNIEQKAADKVELKFKVGDMITNGEIIGKVDEIINNKYHGWFGYNKDLSVHYADIPDVENWHLWTIQDAKAGDVLVNQNGEMPFIFKSRQGNHIYCYCAYTNHKDRFFPKFVNDDGTDLHWINLFHEQVFPATKEQRDKLEKAMADAGYTFDFEKKELKKIEQKPENYKKQVMSEMVDCVKDYIKQKPAWSEEDEEILNLIIARLHSHPSVEFKEYGKDYHWLKSLKHQNSYAYNPYKTIVESIAAMVEKYATSDSDLQDFYNNVKVKCKDAKEYDSLYPQSTWKPSDYQIEALESATENCSYSEYQDCLQELIRQLKKLREE